MTIAEYLLFRLKELGIKDIFGVPGDYNLTFLDQIECCEGLHWVGNCNELNAAYAADGYARINGISAMVTTFGVGELSAINGIAGSYAEYLPVVNIVGSPSLDAQYHHAIMHHTFGTGDFSVFIKMFEKMSCYVAILDSPEMAASRIDEALETCWIKKRPVYISLPCNMVDVAIKHASRRKLNLAYPESNKSAIKELATKAAYLIKHAKAPVILADLCAVRHPMKPYLFKLLEQTGIPFATMNLGKGVISETHPNFLGLYVGDCSSPGVQARVEQSDCIVSFGLLLSDFNTGEFTTHIDADVSIAVHSDHVNIKHAYYPGVYFDAVIPAITEQLIGYQHREQVTNPSLPAYTPQNKKITQKRFWRAMGHFFEKNDILIAETGTSMFGLNEVKLPDDVTVISQTLWTSIGYTVGAVLGAALADPSRRTILFVGDGSFQLTAQELSSVMRHELTPIVFLINNDGYTIERVIHGPRMAYNDIHQWDYTALVKAFGSDVYTATIETELELDALLAELPQHADKMRFIEVKMDKLDCPESLREIGKICERKNKG